MTEPEGQILDRLIERLDKLRASAASDLELLGEVPSDVAGFDAMPPNRQSAARAFLKSFEQIEDQLSRVFRAIPKQMGEDDQRWFARDYADLMERVGVLDDASDWSRVVKLRNQLVHDYPLEPQVQFDRLIEATGHLPFLVETHRRAARFVRIELPGKTI